MKNWFTPADMSSLSLPGLPNSKRAINRVATREEWNKRSRTDGTLLARKRSGRGGGFEYHFSILPPVAVAALTKRGLIPTTKAKKNKARAKSEWHVFEKLSAPKKQVANFRLKVLNDVKTLQRTGVKKTVAIAMICVEHRMLYTQGHGDHHKFNRATVYNWFKLVQSRSKSDWLPALAPKQVGRVSSQVINPAVIDYLRGDYLRPEQPSFMSCFYRLEEVAKSKGWYIPHHRTLERRYLVGVPYPVQVMKRKGMDALEAMFPPQTRDRSDFHAMEAVNADGHVFDVFVTEDGGKTKFRPVMCAIQDLYSNKFVGYRIGKTLGADIVRLSFGDMFRDYGIPDLCWLDNGREFASKMVTGGSKNRYRFKIKAEEPTGFLTALGVDVRWCRPYRGQSKPIERAFRDFCDHIAKHPKFAGAYTGNKVTNKPSNYGEKAVDMKVFKAVVAAGIAAHTGLSGPF